MGAENRFYWTVPLLWLALIGISSHLTFNSLPKLEKDEFSWCCGPSAPQHQPQNGTSPDLYWEQCHNAKNHLAKNSHAAKKI